jgi:hypothetical protein|tara:strand:+ start:245 stop:640 length:396 start_codon:yes stop_codon:yes gene_type:complete
LATSVKRVFYCLHTEITAGATWDGSSGSWNSHSGPWGATNNDNVIKNIVFADVTNTKIFRDSKSNKKDTATMDAYIERTGYDLGDPQSVKFVSAVYPQLEVSGSNTVNVYVGKQMSTEKAITWEGPTARTN